MVNPDRMNIRARRAGNLRPRSEATQVWVLDDPRAGASAPAVGIAERLGVPFRRIGLSWNIMAHAAGLAPRGSLLGLADRGRGLGRVVEHLGRERPRLVISSGSRAAPVARWLKQRLDCRLVHCLQPGVRGTGMPVFSHFAEFDMLVLPEHGSGPPADNEFPVLGAPHRVSPGALALAASQWGERLDYLPRPRVALLVGGPVRGSDLQPARAHALGAAVARTVAAAGGAVLASTSRRTGGEAADALAAGLGRAMHLIHRWGEPGENPYLGFLAMADAIVVTADSAAMLSEACATSVPVHVALADLAGAHHRRLVAQLTEAGQVRPFRGETGSWSRLPLDESRRVADEIRRRFGLG